jgi:hypothetical protein
MWTRFKSERNIVVSVFFFFNFSFEVRISSSKNASKVTKLFIIQNFEEKNFQPKTEQKISLS